MPGDSNWLFQSALSCVRQRSRGGESPLSRRRFFCYGLLGIVSSLYGRLSTTFGEQPQSKLQIVEGQVVRLTDVLKAQDVQLDTDAAPWALALRTADGKLLPILKTLGSRALFQDARLLNRPVQLQAHVLPRSSFLVVHRFYTVKNSLPHEVYYWCETCAIRRDYPDKGVCECCGAPMELREVPLK
ncbi:MAG: hypothetical protein NZM42_01790 [Gemmatales bacterium]|nr:hypothetical protein [Gemmatales bacterium]